jgi:hypothetical protein
MLHTPVTSLMSEGVSGVTLYTKWSPLRIASGYFPSVSGQYAKPSRITRVCGKPRVFRESFARLRKPRIPTACSILQRAICSSSQVQVHIYHGVIYAHTTVRSIDLDPSSRSWSAFLERRTPHAHHGFQYIRSTAQTNFQYTSIPATETHMIKC